MMIKLAGFIVLLVAMVHGWVPAMESTARVSYHFAIRL